MEPTYCVFNTTTESFLALQVSRAATSFSRLKGLLGRHMLRAGHGLWVVPSRGVHTVGLLFPIDVVYLDENNRVVYMVEHLTPFGMGRLRLDSHSVLQLPSHTIFGTGTHVGDALLICPPEELEMQLKNRPNRIVADSGRKTCGVT